jgi:hypothetical protein
MSAIQSQQALVPNTMVQEYRVERVLGMGSLGIVYEAENTYFNEIVALKEFLPSNLACRKGTTVSPISSDVQPSYDWALKKFLDEARTLRELCHPQAHRNIVRVRQFIEQNDTAYMVMDYEQGQPLSEILEKRGVLPEAELNQILMPLLEGLERIHDANIWHRDIKPSNILIRPDHSPVLIDFGAARHEVVGRDPSVMSQYTPGYAAIEQFHDAAEQGPWTDIFALGGTLYRAVTGRKPAKAIERFVNNNVYAPATRAAKGDYSPTLLAAIDAALTLKPEERPQSISDWRRWFDGEVDLGLDDEATIATPHTGAPLDATMVLGASAPVKEGLATPSQKIRKRKKAPPALVIRSLAIVVLAMVVAAVGTLIYQRRMTSEPTLPDRQITVAPVQPPDVTAIRAQVETLLAGLDCAHTRSQVSADGILALSGFVSTPEDLETVRAGVEQIQGIEAVKDTLTIQPRPFCEILGVLAPHEIAGASPAVQTQLNLNNPDHRYRTGDKLVVTATACTAFEGYLYVDYIDSDGSVVHLLPSPRMIDNHLLPGQEIVLGALDANDASGDFVYEIQPPLGPGMVIAIASRHRLWEVPHRPHVETTGTYVPALQSALQELRSREPQGGIVSAQSTIEIFANQ